MNIPEMIVDETAKPELDRMEKEQPEINPIAWAFAKHEEHVAQLQISDIEGDYGCMILTEIDGCDLSMLQVFMPSRSSLGIYSRKEGEAVATAILKVLDTSPNIRYQGGV